MRNVFNAITKFVDLTEGDTLTIWINEAQAAAFGINAMDKIAMNYNGQEYVLDANLTHRYVDQNEVGIPRDVSEKYKIPVGSKVTVSFTQTSSAALDALKRGLNGISFTEKDIKLIMEDISNNRFADTLVTYFSALGFIRKSSDKEIYRTAKYMAEAGEMIKFKGIVADKHCMGGVPGNETTMIMIPLLASLGIKMPKVFSKAITTPAATGECVSVLMDISFTKSEIEALVKKNNCCLVWGGGLDMAPADEKLIKVAYPLSMQSYPRTIASIMAKKYAVGINHSLIDIPVGPTAKVPDMKTAKRLKKKYEYVGKKLGMKVHVEITSALQPIGGGIGATLQVREVLRVLQQHPSRPQDLEDKAVYLASKIIELVGMAKGKQAHDLAYGQLISGAARKKMQKIISAQHGNPDVHSEKLKLAEHTKDIFATKNGKVVDIDMKTLNLLARTLGAPLDLKAGVYLYQKLGGQVKKGEKLFAIYADEKSKIDLAREFLKEKNIYTIK
ncbi:MAG: thymidine phosphorylase [candidate division SR1 bacterium]|nr:thymidine phosphorylase [candidate division SR1 bacterium]